MTFQPKRDINPSTMSQQDRQKDQPRRTAFGAMFRTVRLDKANSAASAADQASQIVLNLDQAGKAEELLTGIKETAKLARGADKLGDSIDKKIEEKGLPVPDQSALERFLPKPSAAPDTTPDNQDPPPHPAVQIFNIIKTDIHQQASEKAGEARQHFLEDRISEGELAAQSSLDLAKKSREIDPLAEEIVTLITQAGYNDIDPKILTRTAIMIQSESAATPPAAAPAETPVAPVGTTTRFILGTPNPDLALTGEGDFPPATIVQPAAEADSEQEALTREVADQAGDQPWSNDQMRAAILDITGPVRPQTPPPVRSLGWGSPHIARPGYMPGPRRPQQSEPAASAPETPAVEIDTANFDAPKPAPAKPEVHMAPVPSAEPASAASSATEGPPRSAESQPPAASETTPTPPAGKPAELTGPTLGPELPAAPAEAVPLDVAPAKPEGASPTDSDKKAATEFVLDGNKLTHNGQEVELTPEERGILLLIPEEAAGLTTGRVIAEKLFPGYGTPGSKYLYELAKLKTKIIKLTGQDPFKSVLGPKGGISLKEGVKVSEAATPESTTSEAPSAAAHSETTTPTPPAETPEAPATAAPSSQENPVPAAPATAVTPNAAPAIQAASQETTPAQGVETSERAETDISEKDELLVRQLLPFIAREDRYTQSTVRGAVIEVNKAELDAISDPKQRQDREMTLTVQAQSRLREIASKIVEGRTKRKNGNIEGSEHAAALAKWVDSLSYRSDSETYYLYSKFGEKGLQGVMSRDYSFDTLKDMSIPSQRGRNLGGGNNKGRKGRNLKK